jgi:hypothetical protein
MSDFQPQFGALPRPEGQPVLAIGAIAPELVAPRAEVHNIELDPDPDMLGNDVWGNCVFVGIENNRRIAAAALSVPITRLTAAQVVAKYCAYNGISTDPKVAAPGPGAVVVNALNWVRTDPAGWGGNHLLFFGDLKLSELTAHQGVSEFQSILTAELIRAQQEYPSKDWTHTLTVILGGHATAGGSYDPLHDFLKTWGMMVTIEPSFFAYDIDEILVVVWDFMWETLSYDRQVQVIADLQALTGKVWTGPAPIIPAPVPTGGNVVIKQYFPSAVFSIVGTIHASKLNEMTGALTAGTTLTAAKPSSASAVARVTVNGVDYGLVVNGTFAGQLIPWALLTWQSGHEPIGPYK